jgi:hypothetical protein
VRKIILFISFLIVFPLCGFAFEISELSKYQAVAVKEMTLTDSLLPKDNNSDTIEITGTMEIDAVLGQQRADFKTKYVYIGDKTLEKDGRTRWYYYYQPSWHGKGRGKLNYDTNHIMKAGVPGDTIVIAKKNKSEIALVIIQSGHPDEHHAYRLAEKKKGTAKPVYRDENGEPKQEKEHGLLWHLFPYLYGLVVLALIICMILEKSGYFERKKSKPQK